MWTKLKSPLNFARLDGNNFWLYTSADADFWSNSVAITQFLEKLCMSMNIRRESSNQPESKDGKISVWFRIWSVIWILVKEVRTYAGQLRTCSKAQDVTFLLQKLGSLEQNLLWSFSFTKMWRILPSEKYDLLFQNYLSSDVQNFGNPAYASL